MTASQTLLNLTAALLAAGAASAQQDRPDAALDPSVEPPPATLAAPPIPAEVTMLRLRSGAIQWGAIEDHDPDSVTVRRLDTGGVVRLPWTLLESTQELDLRQQFGYVDTDGDEILIDGHKLVLHDGSELYGLIINYTDQEFVLKEASGPRLVRKSMVDQVAETQVAALEVYTKDELYLQQAASLADPARAADPEAHYDLARYCERILDFEHALEHYREAARLDPEFRADELPNTVARVELKAQQQEQLELLGEIDRWNRKRLYEKAFAGLAQFDALYEDSPLRADRVKLQAKIERSREAYVKDQIVRLRWYSWMERLAAQKVRENLPFDAVLAYAEESMSEDIAKAVTEDARKLWPDIETDQVRQMWLERKPGRLRAASYGLGTWLLGEDAALKGSAAAAAPKAAGNERDARRDDLEQKIQRFLKNQQTAQRSRRSEDETSEIDDFWLTFSQTGRRNWLIAFYAENAGDMETRPEPHLQPCPSCGGKGVREVLYTGNMTTQGEGRGGLRLEKCDTCKGIGVVRRVRFR